MSRVIFPPVFILLVGMLVEGAYVEPPTNVTLDCHNLVHVVRWAYTEFSPGLQFNISIGSMYSALKMFSVDSPNLQFDFSLDTDPADTYNLFVSAVVGNNESDDAPRGGIQFSYYKNSVASKKCFMDLPAVNVTVTENGIAEFSFMHPWLLYKDKIPVINSAKKKRHNAHAVIPEFDYKVHTVGKGTSQTFVCNESECEGELAVEKEGKLCLEISGEMKKMAVRGTQEYCAMPTIVEPARDDFTYIIYIMATLLVVIVLILILFMVFKKLTAPSSSLPATMTLKGHLWRAVRVHQEQVSVPEVEPASPTPLLPSTEFPPAITSSAEPEVRERIGVFTGDNGVCEDGEIGNDEGYTQGRNLGDDDDVEIKVESSGYESRPVFDKVDQDGQAEG